MWFIYSDPCGLACVIVGFFTAFYVDFVTSYFVIRPWFEGSPVGIILTALFQVIVGMILFSYVRAMTTDPGSVPKDTATEEDIHPPQSDPERVFKPKRRYCAKCKCIKPPRAHHCSTCKRCINMMDHHCPWVNNCVGSNNLKHFLLFLFWTFIGGIYGTAIPVVRFLLCWQSRTCIRMPLQTLILCAVALVLSIFFMIFVVAMFWDQYQGLTTDTTGIEAMKNWAETPRSCVEGLRMVCGPKFSWRWFVPFQTDKNVPIFYQWSPDDDKDAYDPRDPIIIRHFDRLERWFEQQKVLSAQESAGEDAPTSDSTPSETLMDEKKMKKKESYHNNIVRQRN